MSATQPHKQSQRVQAVLALLRGEPIEQVSAHYGLCRSTLYKFRQRAQRAIEQALEDKPRGPRQPHNRLDEGKERTLVSLCQRHSTSSARRIAKKFGTDSPSLRTIQRIRRRHHLGRFPKRAPATVRAQRLTSREKKRAWKALQDKPRLGPERLAWDLQNESLAPLHGNRHDTRAQTL